MCRLTGTNADKGNKMLSEFSAKNKSLKILVADSLDDAAVKAVSTLKKWFGYDLWFMNDRT